MEERGEDHGQQGGEVEAACKEEAPGEEPDMEEEVAIQKMVGDEKANQKMNKVEAL